MNDVLELAQTFQMATKAVLMYTAAHPRSKAALVKLAAQIEGWLGASPTLHIAASGGRLFLNGGPVEGNSLHLTALCRQLTERQISGFVFKRGIEPDEVLEVLNLLILKPARIEEAGGAAQVLARKNLPHVQLGQTQYREVREGDGGENDAAAPSLDAKPPAGDPQPPAPEAAQGGPGRGPLDLGDPNRLGLGLGPDPVATMADQWREAFSRFPPVTEDSLANLYPADLDFLGDDAVAVGIREAYPNPGQMEALRTALHELPPATVLSMAAGMHTLPPVPAGLGMAMQSLMPEVFGRTAVQLISDPALETQGKAALVNVLATNTQAATMLSATEGELRRQGLDLGSFQDLMGRLAWEQRDLEDQVRTVLDHGQLWNLSHDQRLRLLRRLLQEGREEPFTAILEKVVQALAGDDAPLRETAVRCAAGIAGWTGEPGLFTASEGLLIQGLTAHFGWESLPGVHRICSDALGAVLAGLVHRGDPAQAMNLVQELQGLCLFLGSSEPWREEAMTRLREGLGEGAVLDKVVELIHTCDPETLLRDYMPFFEVQAGPASRALVKALGEEPDRRRRGRLMEVIRGLGDLAVPAVEEHLSSPQWFVVRNTLNLLTDMGDAAVIQPAITNLRHADGRVRRAAVRALWKVGGPAGAPALIASLAANDPDTQMEILFALGQLRAPEAIGALGEFALEARNGEKLRIRAAETLGLIGDAAAIPALEALIRRRGRFITSAEPTEVRVAACRALLALGTAQARTTLMRLTGAEPRNSDRQQFMRILEQFPTA